MKFPLSWLKDYIDIEMPPQEIAKILTMTGIEVDLVEPAKIGFDQVVVSEVLSTQPHPNADKLVVAEVFDGAQKYQIVCGAPNCRAGMKTALALVGANITFPDGEVLKVKKSKIRGIESYGMLCSGAELGISSEEEGIFEFSEHLKLGADVAEIYSDTLFEVSLTPNLNHASSLIGIARELSALTGSRLKMPLIYLKEEGSGSNVKVTIEDKIDCPRYAARVIEGLKEQSSPEWLKKRLKESGIRPSFLAVDVTNYVLLEMGHPLHAFDLDTIENEHVIVRKAKEGEKIETLDGKVRVLNSSMLVIADVNKPLAIAGVMGGANSEVKATTKRILIESAYFRPGSIRKTSKALGLSTEASKRFERGCDPSGITQALDRAAMMIQELSGAHVLKGKIDVKTEEVKPLELICRVSKVNSLLGTRLSVSEVEELLKRLEFKVDSETDDILHVKVPTFRTDIFAEVDLIEEVARLVGYDNIPRKEALARSSLIPNSPMYDFEREVRRRLISEGLQEFLTCDLIGPKYLEIAEDPKMSKDALIHVLNPNSIEQSVLRTSLLQGLLHVVKFNHDRENHTIRGFEVGRVHFKADGQYQEPSVAGIILSGKNQPYHMDPKPNDVDFFDLKGIIENLLEGLNIKRYTFRFSYLDTFHTGRQALIQVDGVDVGSLGEIHPTIQRKLDVPERIYFAELNLVDLLRAKRGDLKMKPIPEYPASERDWTVTLKEEVPIYQLISSIQHIPSNLLEKVSLVDIFRSEKLGEGVKNVTLHFVYRDKTKTVAQLEVDNEHARIIEKARQMNA